MAAALVALTAAMPAAAQVSLGAGVDAATDERRRGLGWSGGDASIGADVQARTGIFEARARVSALRGSVRHGGADAVTDLQIAAGWDFGPIRARAKAVQHLFSGTTGKTDYAEAGVDASYSLGPAQVSAGAWWAPDQAAIGGSNLYLYATGNVGIPATPLTLVGAIGRSSGHVDDPQRAARLRPAGRYTDWQVGVEHVTGPLTLALDYVGTDVDEDAVVSAFGDRRNSGDKILARARLSF